MLRQTVNSGQHYRFELRVMLLFIVSIIVLSGVKTAAMITVTMSHIPHPSGLSSISLH
jgi:hypothetical protein